MKNRSMGSHQSARMITDEWLTPPEIISDLGPFDLDPCSPINRPWNTAKNHYTINDDGLLQDWYGFVWCNPPYGQIAKIWLEKMATHNNGIALIFARTETDMFFKYVWGYADAVLFIEGRIYFYNINGERARANAGAPSVLVGYGRNAVERLRRSKIRGKFIQLIDL